MLRDQFGFVECQSILFLFWYALTYGQISFPFQSPESYLANRSVKRGFDDRTRQDHRLSSSETAGSFRDSKRLKSFNYGPDSVGVKSSGHSESTVFRSESLMASKSDLELKSVAALASEKMPPISNDSCANNYICGFCQSSRISEVSCLCCFSCVIIYYHLNFWFSSR